MGALEVTDPGFGRVRPVNTVAGPYDDFVAASPHLHVMHLDFCACDLPAQFLYRLSLGFFSQQAAIHARGNGGFD